MMGQLFPQVIVLHYLSPSDFSLCQSQHTYFMVSDLQQILLWRQILRWMMANPALEAGLSKSWDG